MKKTIFKYHLLHLREAHTCRGWRRSAAAHAAVSMSCDTDRRPDTAGTASQHATLISCSQNPAACTGRAGSSGPDCRDSAGPAGMPCPGHTRPGFQGAPGQHPKLGTETKLPQTEQARKKRQGAACDVVGKRCEAHFFRCSCPSAHAKHADKLVCDSCHRNPFQEARLQEPQLGPNNMYPRC